MQINYEDLIEWDGKDEVTSSTLQYNANGDFKQQKRRNIFADKSCLARFSFLSSSWKYFIWLIQ